jgi:hypothetical protein
MTLETIAPLSDDPILACPRLTNPAPPEITMARHHSYTTGWDAIPPSGRKSAYRPGQIRQAGSLSKHVNCHPLTVVNLSSDPWFAPPAAGQSERRSSITRSGERRSSSGAQVAQLVEHVTENHGVGGSIPPLGTI